MRYLDYSKEQLIQRIEEMEALNLELEGQNEVLQELSAFDCLTKISNQRTLVDFLKSKLEDAERTKNPLCVAMFDIDDFKRINDNNGHVIGNTILCEIAEIIQNNTRATDLAGRYGGDEFMLILTNTELKVAQHIAERIRRAVEEKVFIDGLRITISGGVKQYAKETFIDLIHLADLALYKAKEHGKNKIL